MDGIYVSDTGDKLPFGAESDNTFNPPEHLNDFESNAVDFDKTTQNFETREAEQLKNKINQLENKINSLENVINALKQCVLSEYQQKLNAIDYSSAIQATCAAWQNNYNLCNNQMSMMQASPMQLQNYYNTVMRGIENAGKI